MQAVILAGGLGTRLQPLTQAIPKPLLPIGEKSLLEIQIERLKQGGFEEIFLATNFKSDYVANFFGDGSKYGVKLHISQEDEPLGTAGPVGLLRDRIQDPFIVMNGDILSTIDFRQFFEFALGVHADLCVAIKRIIAPFAFGRISYEGHFVTGIEEKPNLELEVLAGIYVFKPAIFDWIPSGEYFGMDTLIQSMLREGVPVAKYSMREIWLDIGQLPDYEEAQDVYREHFARENS
jgi:NDP-sugar pyrophosphorylase family protein